MRTASLALLLCVGIAIGATPASAYVVMTSGSTELRWTSLPMKFNIHTAPAPGVSAAATQAAFRAAYQSWSTVSCSSFRSQDLGLVNLPWGDTADHVNTHTFNPSWSSSYDKNALGITWTQYDPSSGKIMDADTHYNPTFSWSTSGSAFAIDVQAVATHEIGHQLGLDHSLVQQATMFYATGNGDTSQRSLHSDDISGLCYLYPNGKPLPPECSLPDHCAPNETCSNGKCVTAVQKGYGSSCSSAKDCQSGLCMQSGSFTFCSQTCDGQACPNGDQCVAVSGSAISKACLYGSASWGTKSLGEPCTTSTDCKTNLCGALAGKGYLCLQKCDRAKQDCPASFSCVAANDGNGYCVPADPPPPPPVTPPVTEPRKVGESCSSSSECESGLCGQNGARRVCLQTCGDPGGSAGCPTGQHCAAVPDASLAGCLEGEPLPLPTGNAGLGEACQADVDCSSNRCFDNGDGQLFCSEPCDPEKGCRVPFDCISQGDDPSLCLPARPAEPETESKGCALSTAASTGSGTSAGLLLLGLAVLGLVARRRSDSHLD